MLAARGNHIRAPQNSTRNANLRAFCFSASHTHTRWDSEIHQEEIYTFWFPLVTNGKLNIALFSSGSQRGTNRKTLTGSDDSESFKEDLSLSEEQLMQNSII